VIKRRFSDAGPWPYALLAIAAAVAFVGLVGAAAARFMGVDDAYYLAIGENILRGRGPVTAFGTFAGLHGPIWPLAVAAPAATLGIDPTIWAHFLVVISGGAVVLLIAGLAWRADPRAAPLAGAVMLGFPFMVDLATGMGLDLPATALTLGYLAIGLAAVLRGSFRLGVLAGIVFAAAFLTKEVALPFGPVPLFAALVRGAPLARTLRTTAAILLAALVSTSWWFVVFAQQTATVYRIGTPSWTLLPLGIAAIALAVAGLTAGRWLPSAVTRDSARWRNRLWRLGWLGSAGWAVALTVMFARTPNGTGSSFLVPAQVASNLARWMPVLGMVLGFGLVGLVAELGARVREWSWRRRPEAASPPAGEPEAAITRATIAKPAIDDLLIATICGFPLILLVISVGEGPRHYLAQVGLLVAIGANGWIRLAARTRRRDPASVMVAIVAVVVAVALATPTLAPLVDRRLVLRLVAVAVVALVAGFGVLLAAPRFRIRVAAIVPWLGLAGAVAAAAVLVSVVVPLHRSSIDRIRAEAVGTISAWVRSDVPSGSSIIVAHLLANELALPIQAENRPFLLAEDSGIRVRADAPLGIAIPGGPAVDDWLAIRASTTDVTTLYGYRATTIHERLRAMGPAIWIESEIIGGAQRSPIINVLERAQGVTEVAGWSWPYGSGKLVTRAFRIDPANLAFDDRLVITQDALRRIVVGLEAAGPTAQPAAAALAARLEVVEADDPATTALLESLARLASPS
jgi:hypothetical protein